MFSGETKQLGTNMVLSALRGMMSVVFPLITFPYVSRVLGVGNLGKYSFANSIISYLVLVAGLGIGAYAIREGARIRQERALIESFSAEMFSINLCSTLVSYLVLIILLCFVSKFDDYRSLLVILSLQIVFKTLGIEWLYSIYEDYAYITIRSFFFQLISLCMLFLFVKNEDDVNVFAVITVLSSVGSNILNYIHSGKYCRVRLTRRINWRCHLKPILTLFAMSATIVIYVSSDITILGFLCDDRVVGIYSVSTKIYTVFKTILSSILIVAIPRLSSQLGEKKYEEFHRTSNETYKTLIAITTPTIVGVAMLREEIVLFLSSSEYIMAKTSLMLLCVALFFCMGAWFWGQCVLVPCQKERVVFGITIISASLNIILNFLLIPAWKEDAAALTTIIAEGVSFACCGYIGRKYVKIDRLPELYIKTFVGCLTIVANCIIIRSYLLSGLSYLIIAISASIVLYIVVEVALKNEVIYRLYIYWKNKLKGKLKGI